MAAKSLVIREIQLLSEEERFAKSMANGHPQNNMVQRNFETRDSGIEGAEWFVCVCVRFQQ